MSDQHSGLFTEDDVRALGRRLRELKATLSPGEQQALKAIVLWAVTPVRGDTQGYIQLDDEHLWRVIPADPDWDDIIGGPGAEQV